MWFDKKQGSETVTNESQPQHWPTERMIEEGHTEYATPEDLEALPESILADIAQLCEVDEFAPDECIPCLAHVLFLKRQAPTDQPQHPVVADYVSVPVSDEEPGPLPEGIPEVADDYAGIAEAEREIFAPEAVAERFARQVGVLDALVKELLEGPPIPPPGVTLEELSLLVVGAQRWIAITEAQGVELSLPQQQVLDATKALVARLHRG